MYGSVHQPLVGRRMATVRAVLVLWQGMLAAGVRINF
jgi:hypothetical protein